MPNLRLAALFALLFAAVPLGAAELPESLVLVAAPELNDPVYGKTVVVVTTFAREQHLGFIVNRPTRYTLSHMFPEHGPSKEVQDPVYLGGPFDTQAIFALVAQPESPGGQSIELMPGLYAAVDAPTVDRIIERNPEEARFVAGLVVWRPGELQHELDIGAWQTLEADPQLALRKPEGLWEELVKRSVPKGAPKGNFLRTRYGLEVPAAAK